MTTVPIVFAFDNSWIVPASVCIYSLLANAGETTVYDIYILHPREAPLQTEYIGKVAKSFPRHKVRYIGIGGLFDKGFQIRGINTLTYYRLLIPRLIQQYDTIIYSDVDVVFQNDLSHIYNYNQTDLTGKYLGAVNSLAHYDKDRKCYYESCLKLDPTKIFYAGNIIINSKAIREDGLVDLFLSMIETKYRFQDMDILNIACRDRVEYLSPAFCVTTYFCESAVNDREKLLLTWSDIDIKDALSKGVIHYNGRKPWQGYCPNFDIWWEYYRKSPIFNEKFYFDFFYGKLDELDRLPLLKRIKILARYFVYGKK